MTVEPEMLGFIAPIAQAGGRGAATHPAQQASLRLAEFRDGRSNFKARDLVGLLLSHGARAYRASQPVSVTRMRVRGLDGAASVRLRLR